MGNVHYSGLAAPLRLGARASHDLASSTPLPVGGWRQRWLTRPRPEDPEPGERSNAMTGACLIVSQLKSIPWAAAPSSASLLLVTSVFVTPIVTRGNAAKPCTSWAAAAVGAPVSCREKETGADWRKEMPTRIDRSRAATKTNRPPW